jgi:hypothetical protein
LHEPVDCITVHRLFPDINIDEDKKTAGKKLYTQLRIFSTDLISEKMFMRNRG